MTKTVAVIQEPGRVSIIMLTYNSVAYIKTAIASVRAQQYPDWELIISDDGSEDGTWELVQVLAAQDPRIRASQNPQRLGIVRNRAAASDLCRGEFRAHLDGDDALEPWSIATMIEAFARSPGIQLFYSDLAQIDRWGAVELYSASRTFDRQRLHQHGWRHFGMYRAAVLDHIAGYNTQLISACEDGDLFMQIAEHWPSGIQRLPRVLYNYRNHGANTVSQNKTCSTCEERPVCNYVRVWAASAGYDVATFQPRVKA